MHMHALAHTFMRIHTTTIYQQQQQVGLSIEMTLVIYTRSLALYYTINVSSRRLMYVACEYISHTVLWNSFFP